MLKGVRVASRHAGEARLLGERQRPRGTDLVAQAGPRLGRQPARQAQEDRRRGVDAADGVERVLHGVAAHRLDHQHPAVVAHAAPDGLQRAERVGHVVHAVEQRHEVVVAGEPVGRHGVEADAVGEPLGLRLLACEGDGRLVVVGADEEGGGVGPRHDAGRRAQPAADVGHLRAAAQPVVQPGQRRDPLGRQVGQVAGPEEPLGALEQVLVVLVPAHAGAGPERLGQAVGGTHAGRLELEAADDVGRAVLVGEARHLLRRQPEAVLAAGLDVARGRHREQPLGDVPRRGAGALGQRRPASSSRRRPWR